MSEDWQSIASKYRREAEHLRHAVEMIEEARLRQQLLSMAQDYETAAASIEQQLRLKVAREETVQNA